jgi:hypothetical protein
MTWPAWRFLLLLFCLLLPVDATADAIVVTRAMSAPTVMEVFIDTDVVRVELEIGIEDLDAFQRLLPDALLEKMEIQAPPLEERLPLFFKEDLTIRMDDNPPLPGFVESMEGRTRIDRDEVTGESLRTPGDDAEAVVFVKLRFPFQGRPETFAIKPPTSGTGAFVGANIGFITYHLGLPVMDFRYLGMEESADLDWEDPWYSRFRNKNLWRRYNAPISAFLYIEPYEVRVEVVARPRDLQEWVDLGLEDAGTFPVEMQPEMERKVAKFLGNHINLTIEEKPVSPLFNRINFLRRTLRSSTVIEPREELDALSATMGAIFVHSTTGLPRNAALQWELFASKFPEVRAAATDEAGSMPYRLLPDDNVLAWQNFLKNPTIPALASVEAPPPRYLRWLPRAGLASIMAAATLVAWQGVALSRGRRPRRRAIAILVLLLGIGLGARSAGRASGMTHDRAKSVVGALLQNVYVAFDYRQEDLIYDTLARSVTGDLLTEIYLETKKSLELAGQGGARVKVKNVEVKSVESQLLKGESGFSARCIWNVGGSVGHWGHIHQRMNQYEALIVVKPVDGKWKITTLELIQEERVS